jgi:hypothetical protein
MTEDLTKLGQRALQRAKASLEKNGCVNPFFIFQDTSGACHEVVLPERIAGLLNSGHGKDVMFQLVRDIVQASHCTAVVIVTEAWVGEQTKKGQALPMAEFLEYASESGFGRGIAEGIIERLEAISVCIQTPQEALILTQEFLRDEAAHVIVFGESTEAVTPIDEFHGRQKMFGDLSEANLR